MLGELIAKASNQKDERRQKKFELMKRHVRAMERIAAALETLAAAETLKNETRRELQKVGTEVPCSED